MTIVHYSKLEKGDKFRLSDNGVSVFQLVESKMVVGADPCNGFRGSSVIEVDNLTVIKTLEPRLSFQGIRDCSGAWYYYPNRGIVVLKAEDEWALSSITIPTNDHFTLV